MPTYEYICEKCGHVFEYTQSMNDEPLKVCTKEVCPAKKCGRGKVKRQIGAGAGLIFKGSGFYITDYRSDSYKQAAQKDSSAAASSSAAAAAPAAAPASSDSKAAPAKAESKPKAKPSKV